MARRPGLLLTIVLGFVVFFSISWLFSSHPMSPEQIEYLRANLQENPLRKSAPKPIKTAAEKFEIDVESMPSSLLDPDEKPDNATLK